MHQELKDSLFKKYPSLYTNEISIGCGNGWYNLINVLSELIVDRSTKVEAIQVKEKFGELRFYYKNTSSDYIEGIVRMAGLLSGVICEECGDLGTTANAKGAMRTRCQKHKSFLEKKIVEEPVELPFEISGIGKSWLAMVTNFYLHVNANRHMYTDLEFGEVTKEFGHLTIEIGGGDDVTDAMIRMMLAYAAVVDEETGELIR